MAGRDSRARAFLELTRPANVTTALADVLAGFAVADARSLPALAALLVSTACLYAGGVVLNDVFDRGLDARERPERPVPSGRVSARQAAIFGALLLAAGVIAAFAASRAAGGIAAAIGAAVLLYDARLKHHAVFGPVAMGTCRALNLVLGMAAIPGRAAAAWPLALINGGYIAGVTLTSRSEVSGGGRRTIRAGLVLVAAALAALTAIVAAPAHRSLAGLALVALLAWRVLPAFWRAGRVATPDLIRTAVRRGVLSLALVNAAIAVAYTGMIEALAILALAAAAVWLARRFAVT